MKCRSVIERFGSVEVPWDAEWNHWLRDEWKRARSLRVAQPHNDAGQTWKERLDTEVERHLTALDDLLGGIDDKAERRDVRHEYIDSVEDGWVQLELTMEPLRRVNERKRAERAERMTPGLLRQIRLRVRAEELAPKLDDDEFERWLAMR